MYNIQISQETDGDLLRVNLGIAFAFAAALACYWAIITFDPAAEAAVMIAMGAFIQVSGLAVMSFGAFAAANEVPFDRSSLVLDGWIRLTALATVIGLIDGVSHFAHS